MPTAVIYARVSTRSQEDNASLESQMSECRKYAADNNYTVTKEVKEVYSGHYLFDRPLLNETRDEIRQGRFDALIVYDVDRLSRNVPHLGILLDECQRFNTRLVFVRGDFEHSPEGMLLFSIRGYLAEAERLKIIERTTRGRRAKAKAGTLSFKRKLYGYQLNEKGGREIYEPEAEVVKRLFRDFLAGKSLREIAKELNDARIPTPSNKSVWWANSVAVILKNPAYKGNTVIFRQKKESRYEAGERIVTTKNQPASENMELPEGTTPAIISEKDFEAAQRMLIKNKKQKRGMAKRDFLLRGLIRCAACGRLCSPQVSYSYKAYVCTSKQNPTLNCKTKMCSAAEAEQLVWSEVLKIIKRPSLIEKLLKKNRPARDLKPLQNSINRIEKEIRTLILRAESVDDESWEIIKERLGEKRSDLAKLKRQKAEIEAETKEQTINAEGFKSLALQIAPDLNKLEFADKLQFLKLLKIECLWDGETLEIFIGE